ncbi:MAG: glutathione S-transferase family protein [Arenimonas sp.]
MSEAAVSIVYGMKASGNCFKVQLLLEHLGAPYRWVEVNSVAGETRTAQYLAKNPNGKVPLLELADGRLLPESNAILCYLAEGSRYLPAERWQRAQTLQWLFFEQYSHEPFIAVARYIMHWLPSGHPRREELPRLRERGYQALDVMEKHLSAQPFFVDSGYGVADMALYAYTHESPMGGFDLSAYPSIQAWLARVESQPGFVAHRY